MGDVPPAVGGMVMGMSVAMGECTQQYLYNEKGLLGTKIREECCSWGPQNNAYLALWKLSEDFHEVRASGHFNGISFLQADPEMDL